MAHPNTIRTITANLEPGSPGSRDAIFYNKYCGCKLTSNVHMNEFRDSTTRFIMPGGKEVDKEDISVTEGRFIEYDVSDFNYLIRKRIIKPALEANIYILDDSKFTDYTNMMPKRESSFDYNSINPMAQFQYR